MTDRSCLGLQLKAPIGEIIEQAIRLDFPASNNEAKYEAIIAGIDLTISVSSKKIIIRNNSQLVVGQVNGEHKKKKKRRAHNQVCKSGHPLTRKLRGLATRECLERFK